MTQRHIHYEAAFEDYLRSRGLPYVAVDEAKRAIFRGSKLKSFDFLVYQSTGPNWLVDVKGRKFPYDTPGNHRTWENWVTQEDLDDLKEWEGVFGDGFQAVLLFAYWMTGWPHKYAWEDLHRFRGELYAFLAAPLGAYQSHCVPRSPQWGTVTVPARTFRRLATRF